MKPVGGILLGLFTVLLESSLVGAPWVLVYVWWITKKMPYELTAWLCLALGLILDVLLVQPVGLSSLFLVGFVIILWYERQILARSAGVDVFFLLLGGIIWSFWRGQSLVIAALIMLLTMLGQRVSPRSAGVTLRARI